MSDQRRLTRSALLLLTSQIAGQGLNLARNIVLARLLGPEDMGIAAAIGMTLTLAELASDFSVDRIVIQSQRGNKPTFQRTAHLVAACRGVAAGVLVAALAIPLATAFDIFNAWPAFMLMAVVPIVRGFVHLDFRRVQRDLDYSAQIRMDISANVAAIVVAWFSASVLSNYWAFVCSIIAQAVAYVYLSHQLRVRSYRMAFDKSVLREILKFGAPLAVNGILLFVVMQGDRFMVGMFYSMEDLGRFAVASGLVLIPTLIIGRVNSSISLPILSRAKQNLRSFDERYRKGMEILALVAILVVVGAALLGNTLIRVLYGEAFQSGVMLMSCLACLQGMRIVREMPNTCAVSVGDTRIPLYSSLVRLSGVTGAAIVAFNRVPLEYVVAAGVGGELLAFGAAALLLRRRHGIHVASTAMPVAPLLVAMGGVVIVPRDPILAGTLIVMAIAWAFNTSRLWSIRETVFASQKPVSVSISGEQG